MKKREFTGEKLLVDEYLLKVDPKDNMGFLSKLSSKGTVNKSFDEWRATQKYDYTLKRLVFTYKLPIVVHKETFKKGWELVNWRFGMSQNWAVVKHPDGFLIEVYLHDLLEVFKKDTVINCKLQGEYKWEKNKLIKK